jgi:hypothetical protein
MPQHIQSGGAHVILQSSPLPTSLPFSIQHHINISTAPLNSSNLIHPTYSSLHAYTHLASLPFPFHAPSHPTNYISARSTQRRLSKHPQHLRKEQTTPGVQILSNPVRYSLPGMLLTAMSRKVRMRPLAWENNAKSRRRRRKRKRRQIWCYKVVVQMDVRTNDKSQVVVVVLIWCGG